MIQNRRALGLMALPLLAALGCAPAPAEPRPVARQAQNVLPVAAPLRMPFTLDRPVDFARPNRQHAWQAADPPPIPNRAIEPPPDRTASANAASLEPFLLPPERHPGMTFGREHLRETGPDRPFDNLVPGARFRFPFEASPAR